jgi:outer membrane protein OmpA-like peptidoglycan-associated protein
MLAFGLIIFLVLVLVLGKCVMSLGTDRIVPASGHDYNEIVRVGDETILLEPESVGGKIHQWAGTGKGTYRFKVDDAVFQPGSAAPTPDGIVRIARFAKFMNANPALTVDISVPGKAGGQQFPLLQARAQALRKQLVDNGVSEPRIRSTSGQMPPASEATVYVTLSKGGV